jgi:hypothetical protein
MSWSGSEAERRPQLVCTMPSAPPRRTFEIRSGTPVWCRKSPWDAWRDHTTRVHLALVEEPEYEDRERLRFDHAGWQILVHRRNVYRR